MLKYGLTSNRIIRTKSIRSVVFVDTSRHKKNIKKKRYFNFCICYIYSVCCIYVVSYTHVENLISRLSKRLQSANCVVSSKPRENKRGD